MNTDDFNSIDPALRGLQASCDLTCKSYHQLIFTFGSRHAPFTHATSAAPDDESSATSGSLTLCSQASASTETQASASRAASQDLDFQASTDTQDQALPPQPTPKQPKERASGTSAPNDPIIDGEGTPHLSPAPKHPKQAATKTADKPAKSAP